MIIVGIDPGKNTGVAVWDTRAGKFLALDTLAIHQAMEMVLRLKEEHPALQVVFEDARQRTWYGTGDVAKKQQGAGSIKRDCVIWQDFLTDKGIGFVARHPIKGATKIDAPTFALMSGWKQRCSSHARDAAMLVIGR